jgi:pilus assembly protein CpaD
MSLNNSLNSRLNRGGWSLAALAVLGAALCACASPRADKSPTPVATTPTQQFPLDATAHADEISLDPHPAGLSEGQAAALTALMQRWQDAGGGMITVQVPVRAWSAASLAAEQARLLLLRLGVPPERVRLASYEATSGQPAVIVVGFTAYEPVVPHCGTHWENIANTWQNKPMSNFGCAVTANMAAQIANPADIAGPRAVDAPDAGRRALVIDNYRQGKLTAGAKDQQSSGTVSATSAGSASGSGGGGGG